ncbi:MAG: hypothetical protein PSY14_12410 [bacterium]|nr:hypothetical protein [bacterium]
MEIAQMITGNRPLPRLKTLKNDIFTLLTRFAAWLDIVLAPFESEGSLTLAPVLVPVRISQTRTRRTTASRIYQRRRIATRIAFAMAELIKPSREDQPAYPHKWAERVSKRRAPAAAATQQIRFSATSSSQPLTSAPSTAARRPGGADTIRRARGADAFSGGQMARHIPIGNLHAAAFIPRPMSG